MTSFPKFFYENDYNKVIVDPSTLLELFDYHKKLGIDRNEVLDATLCLHNTLNLPTFQRTSGSDSITLGKFLQHNRVIL